MYSYLAYRVPKTVSVGIIRIPVTIGLVQGDTVRIVFATKETFPPIYCSHDLPFILDIVLATWKELLIGSFVIILIVPPTALVTEQRRTTTAYHFHTFDHVYRNLFQPVHSRESADDKDDC